MTCVRSWASPRHPALGSGTCRHSDGDGQKCEYVVYRSISKLREMGKGMWKVINGRWALADSNTFTAYERTPRISRIHRIRVGPERSETSTATGQNPTSFTSSRLKLRQNVIWHGCTVSFSSAFTRYPLVIVVAQYATTGNTTLITTSNHVFTTFNSYTRCFSTRCHYQR